MTFDAFLINPRFYLFDQAVVVHHGIVPHPEILDDKRKNRQIILLVADKNGFIVIEQGVHFAYEFGVVPIDQKIGPGKVFIIGTVKVQLPLKILISHAASAAQSLKIIFLGKPECINQPVSVKRVFFRMKPLEIFGLIGAFLNPISYFDQVLSQDQFFVLQDVQFTVRKPVESERLSGFQQMKQFVKIVYEILHAYNPSSFFQTANIWSSVMGSPASGSGP
jgi:hypothetical protein